jgi:iron-sulfur cluster repair protein YtfE (RIC family)
MITVRPRKRKESIKKFSRCHHLGLLFCWKITQGLKTGVDLNRICKYVEYFWQQHLQKHIKDEEKILFSQLKDRSVKKALNEHKLIAEQVQEIANHPENNKIKSLTKLVDLVYDHIRYEERILFPHLETKLNREQLDNIGTRILNLPPLLQDEYEDQFWND